MALSQPSEYYAAADRLSVLAARVAREQFLHDAVRAAAYGEPAPDPATLPRTHTDAQGAPTLFPDDDLRPTGRPLFEPLTVLSLSALQSGADTDEPDPTLEDLRAAETALLEDLADLVAAATALLGDGILWNARTRAVLRDILDAAHLDDTL